MDFVPDSPFGPDRIQQSRSYRRETVGRWNGDRPMPKWSDIGTLESHIAGMTFSRSWMCAFPVQMIGLMSVVLMCGSPVLMSAPAKAAADQPAPIKRLTVEMIYSSGEFRGESASVRWMESGGYLKWEKEGLVRRYPGEDREELLVPRDHLIPPGETEGLSVEDYTFSKDESLLLIYTNSKRVWRTRARGDYWILDRSSRELRQLGGDAPPSTLMFAKISPDSRRVAYVRDRDLWVEDLHSGEVRRLTQAPHDRILNGVFDWVYEEELQIRDGFRWSPDSQSIAYWQLDSTGVRTQVLVDHLAGLYPQLLTIPYPKVGEQNSACRLGVLRLDTGETCWMQVPGDPRNHYIARMDWAGSSKVLVLQQLNRLQNTNRVMLAHADSGEVQTVWTETDEAWLDLHGDVRWAEEGKEFFWLSDRSGWLHLERISCQGGKPFALTSGEFDVIQVNHVDAERKLVYFTASPEDPGQRFLHRVGWDGTGMTRVTPSSRKRGTHSYSISPDGRWAVHTASDFDTPPTVDLVSLPDHEVVQALAENKKLLEKVSQLDQVPSEFFQLDIGVGTPLHGWCILPPDLDPKKKYPVLVYIYGEPSGQTVRDSWSGSGRLWHQYLAQQGYVVVSFDSRGTDSPRGHAFRKAGYRKVGILAPQEQAEILRAFLKERSYLDPDRVGIWGWSGGGSSSLHAIFKYPELYKTAISIAPVPNQRFYDTIYQERYMGLPSDNVEGFYEGSPIHHARNLQGNLLLIHGTGDDNCHYQTFEKLVDELIAHDKPFQMMAYPNRTHSISEGKTTTYHLRSLMTRFLLQHLPPGGKERKGK